MEYYQSIQYIAQKSIEGIENIIKFESYNSVIECNGDYLIVFKQNECVCLEELIESIKNKYVKIFIGQAIIIANRILNHLKQLFDKQKITHGNLSTKNIYISLNANSDKFNIMNTFLDIDKIHFVNYQIHQQLNRKQDLQNIKEAIIKLLSQYQNNSQIEKLIHKLNNADGLKNLIQELFQFQNQFVDINKQRLNTNDVIFNYDKRKIYLMEIERVYEKFYSEYQFKLKEFWCAQKNNNTQDSQNDYLFQEEMNKICDLIFFTTQKSIFGIFQTTISQIVDTNDQCDKLEEIFQQIYQSQNEQIEELNGFFQIIQTQIDILFKEQLSLEKECNLKFNLKLNLLTKDKIASEYHKQLAYELSKNNCNEFKESKDILTQIYICLQQQISQYLDYELKIQIIEFMNDMI